MTRLLYTHAALRAAGVTLGIAWATTLGMVVSTDARAADPVPVMVPAPALETTVQKPFGDFLRILGPATVVSPDASLRFRFKYDFVPVVSIPVAYGKTARLDSDLEFDVAGPRAAHYRMAQGTTLFQMNFHHRGAVDSVPQTSWCGLGTIAAKPPNTNILCLSETDEGKVIAVPAAIDNSFFSYDYGDGSKDEVSWFAFALRNYSSPPMEKPAITEMDMPSPDMALIVRILQPEFDSKKGNWDVTAMWSLRGPAKGNPRTGKLSYITSEMPGSSKTAGTATLRLRDQDLSFDYDPDTHLLSKVRLTPRAAVAEATGSAVPPPAAAPLPDPAPWRFGTRDADPASIVLKTGVLKKGDALLSARAIPTPRMKLNSALNLTDKLTLPAGTYAHAAEFTTYDLTGTAMKYRNWCFEGRFTVMMHTYNAVCTPQKGYAIYSAFYDKDWELAAYQTGGTLTPPVASFDLSPAPETEIAGEQIVMRLDDISKQGAELKLGLARDGVFTWQVTYSFAWKDGSARLYFWDRLVTLRYADGVVTSEVTPTDTNRSPAYGTSQSTQRFW